MVYEWGWGEVDRGRGSIWVFLGCPDGFGNSDFAQIVDLFMLYRSIWVSGAESTNIMDLLAEEGSNLNVFSLGKFG